MLKAFRSTRRFFSNKTVENLWAAFAGESQARNKYDYYSKVAEKEGYHYISKIFSLTALNEHQHAKDHFKKLGELYSTKENLLHAMEGEKYECEVMYPEFSKQAEEDGDMEAVNLFNQLAMIEAEHMKRYAELLEMMENDTVYSRDEAVVWKCLKCGREIEGKTPPPKCPACKHPKEYFCPDDVSLV